MKEFGFVEPAWASLRSYGVVLVFIRSYSLVPIR
jgi:hypothetical protein